MISRLNARLTGFLVFVSAGMAAPMAMADVVAANDCIAAAVEARRLDREAIVLTAHVSWTCRTDLLRQGFAKMSVNGQTIGTVGSFSGATGLVLEARTTQPLPLMACITVQGRGDNTETAVTEQQCEYVTAISVPLPRVRLPAGEMSVVPRF